MSDERPFNAADHFWIVAGDETRLWSSRAGEYVALDDAGFAAFLAAGGIATRIASEFELDQVLRQQTKSLSIGRAFSAEEALASLAAIDAEEVRRALGRDDLSADRLEAGDAEKLSRLAYALQAGPGSDSRPPTIEGAMEPKSLEERLAKLEAAQLSPAAQAPDP